MVFRKWLLMLVLSTFSLGVCARSALFCNAEKGGASHSLEVVERRDGAPDFSYLSSTPSRSLVLNCTIDSSLIAGVPVVSGAVVTYPLSGGDSLIIARKSYGYILDMSKLDAGNYCSGVVAKKVTITAGKGKCKIQ